MQEAARKSTFRVWDIPVRLFHWALVALVLYNWWDGGAKGEPFRLHAYIGYAVLVLLFFRLIWGFTGSSFARFADFVRAPGATFAYAKTLFALKPERHAGHNPLGGWMIVLMIVYIAALGLTGILGPTYHDAEEIHEFLGNFVIVIIGLHVLGVVIDSVLTKENLARSMVTGDKPAALYGEKARDLTGGGAARALIAMIVALGVGLGVAVAIDFKGMVDTEVAHQIERGKERELERQKQLQEQQQLQGEAPAAPQ